MNRTTLLIAGLVLVVVSSVGLNSYFYVSFAPELREKRFTDANKDRIALLLFRGGGTEKAVILDDSNGEIVVQFSGGTTTFKKEEIRKIIYNVYGRGRQKEKPSEGATP